MQLRLERLDGGVSYVTENMAPPLPEILVFHLDGRFYKYRSKMMKPGGEVVDYATYIEIVPVVIVPEKGSP